MFSNQHAFLRTNENTELFQSVPRAPLTRSVLTGGVHEVPKHPQSITDRKPGVKYGFYNISAAVVVAILGDSKITGTMKGLPTAPTAPIKVGSGRRRSLRKSKERQ